MPPRPHHPFSGSSQQPTHYQTLGISPAASPDDIRKAYRELAKTLHPDVNSDAPSASRFAVVAQAHAVLSDPEQRRAYDLALLEHRRASAPGGSAATDPSLRQGHYSWVNVASPPSTKGPDLSEFDEIYETFFTPANPQAPAKPAPSSPPKSPTSRRKPK